MTTPRPLLAAFLASTALQLAGPALAHAGAGSHRSAPHRVHHVRHHDVATATAPAAGRGDADAAEVAAS